MSYSKIVFHLSICFVMLTLSARVSAQDRLPRFEDYHVREVFNGKYAAPRINFPKAREYRTALKEYGKGPPDFAGHYRVVDIGCGADCVFIFVVDVVTGRVYYPGVHLNFDCYDLLRKEEGRAFYQYHRPYRLDSRLLLSIGKSKAMGRGLFYYEWQGSRFRLIHKLVGRD